MGILNYTTTISAARTASEMQALLAKHGAQSVSLVYDTGQPRGIAFVIATDFGQRSFQLPTNATGVEATIKRQQASREIRNEPRYRGAEHANRVAWRILKDWLEAQLAIIEAGMAALDEVMLPYMVMPSGETVTERYRLSAGSQAQLEAGVA